MILRKLAPLSLLVPIVAAVACGSATPAPSTTPSAASAAPTETSSATAAPTETTPPAASSSAAANPSAPVDFDAMSNQQKMEFMKNVVMPRMAKVFQDHDAKDYASFGCKTCHGDPPKDPHDALPKLKLSGDGLKKLQQDDADMLKFMHDKVMPEMAAIFGQQPYDPQTKQGFGCKGCHTVE